jgi:hypothetical protein
MHQALAARLTGKYLLLTISNVSRTAVGYDDNMPLSAAECSDVRRRVTHALRTWAKNVGVDHGLVTYSVGPALTPDKKGTTRRTFAHRVALLGELDLCSPVERVRNDLAIGSRAIPLEVGGPSPVRLRHLRLHVQGPCKTAVRRLLLGSAASYRSDNLPLFDSTDDSDGDYQYGGIPGALALQPCFMFRPRQWADYEAATRNVKSYSLFGEWHSKPAAGN